MREHVEDHARPCLAKDLYWCLWCCRFVVGDAVVDDDGDVTGFVFVHDDVPHPPDATYDEDDRPQ